MNLIRDQRRVYFNEETVLKYFTQIAFGVEYLDSLSLIHLDLKTQDILLSRDRSRIKLSEFSASKQLNTRPLVGSLFSYPNTMSPEMFEDTSSSAVAVVYDNNNSKSVFGNCRVFGQAADVWAMGCVLYEMFMLRRAFTGDNLLAIVRKVVQVNYAPLGDHVSDESKDLVMKLISYEEDSRPTVKAILRSPLLQKHLTSDSVKSDDEADQFDSSNPQEWMHARL